MFLPLMSIRNGWGSFYNDIFGIFVSGPNPSGGNYNQYNLATVPGTTLPVTVNNINNGSFNTGPCTHCNYYVDNTNGTSIEYDGFTTVIKVAIPVTPCVPYHIKIAIGDVGDHSYDSGIFLKSNSFCTNTILPKVNYTQQGVQHSIEGCTDAIVSFKLLKPTSYDRVIHYTVGGTATEGTDYNHLPDSMIIPANQDSVSFVISPVLDGVAEGNEFIELIVETTSCHHDTLKVDISDYNPVSVNITGADSICEGDSLFLGCIVQNGSIPFRYMWNTGDSLLQTKDQPAQSQHYTIQVTDFCGFTATDSHYVEVVSKPLVTLSISNDSICAGDTLFLEAQGADNYLWNGSAINTTNASSAWSLPSQSGTYQVIGSNTFGCQDSTEVPLTVLSLPQVQISASKTHLCPGDSSLLEGQGAAFYSWSSGLGSHAQLVVNPNTTTTYKLHGIGSNGCVDSSSITLFTHLLPQVQFTPAQPEICQGQSTQIQISGAQNYIWKNAGNTISTQNQIQVSPGAGQYRYLVDFSNQWGCQNSDSVLLTVYSNPHIELLQNDTTICPGDSILLQVFGANNYTWSPANYLSSSIGNQVWAMPNNSSLIYVTGTDSNQCTDQTQIQIDIASSPQINPIQQSICEGDFASMQVNGAQVLWSNGSTGNTIQVNPSSSSTYQASISDSLGCNHQAFASVIVHSLPQIQASPAAPEICVGDMVQIQLSGAQNYQWTPAIGLSSTTGHTVTANPNSTTTYTIVGQSTQGCIDTLLLTVVVHPLPTLKTPADTFLCINQSSTLQVSGGVQYTWSPTTFLNNSNSSSVICTPNQNITYQVTTSDIHGCESTDSIRVQVSPQITIQASPNRICFGDSAMISATANVPGSYLWNTGTNSSSFLISPQSSTPFTVTVTDSLGCSASKSINLHVDQPPQVSLQPQNPDLCSGASVALNASGALSYKWYPTTGLSSHAGASVSASPSTSKTYSVIGFNAHGCSDTAFTHINVIPSPTVTLTPSTDTFCLGASTLLLAGGAQSYQWSPAAGLSALTGSSTIAQPNHSTRYKVMGTASNGCTDSAFADIIVHPLPFLHSLQDSNNICLGDSILIEMQGANNYIWSPINGLSANTGSQVYAKPSVTTQYTVQGTTLNGCIDSMDVYVGVHPYPTISISPMNPHICPGSSVSIIAQGADQYLWSPSTGLNSTIKDTIIATPTQTTTYQLVGKSLFGCSDTLHHQITVSPIASIQPSNAAICVGDSVLLLATANTNSTFVWSTGQTGSSIWVKPNASTTYSVTASDSTGCSHTVQSQVTVHALPNLSLLPMNPAICPGESLSIQAQGANSYQWQGPSLSSTSGQSILASPANTSNYTVIGTSSQSCVDSISFQITVHPAPQVQVSPSQQYICKGQSTGISASGAQNYAWTPHTSLNASNLASVIASPIQNTLYQVIGSNTYGCQDTAYAQIDVYGQPQINASAHDVCPGDSAFLQASTLHIADSLVWSNGQKGNSLWALPISASYYSVQAYYPGGCSLNDSVLVGIYNDPSVHAYTQNHGLCPGDSVQLFASQAQSYQWSTSGSGLLGTSGVPVYAAPTQNQSFTVTGTSIHGCISTDNINLHVYPKDFVQAIALDTLVCKNDTVSLIASGVQSYQWLGGANLSATHQAHVIAQASSSTVYSVLGIDSFGCKSYAQLTIHVNQGPNIYITPANPIVCQGDTGIIQGHGAVSYQWTPNMWINGNSNPTAQIYPLSNITYNLRGYDSLGCYNDTSVYVNVKRNPVMSVSPAMDSICMGDSIRLIAQGAGGNGSYMWAGSNGGPIVMGDTIYVSPQSNTNYQITGISTDGCSKSINAYIKVNPKPIVQLHSNYSQICLGDTVSLTASGALNYFWSLAPALLSNSGSQINAQPNYNSEYRVLGSNIYGCLDSASQLITVHSLPQLNIAATSTQLCIGESTHLTASGAQSYTWSSSNGSTTSGNSFLSTPSASTTWHMVGTDSNSCVNYDSIQLQVNPRPNIQLQASATHICAGDSLSLQVQSNGSFLSYLWNNGDTTPQITYPLFQNTQFIISAWNQFGCDSHDSIDIQVNPLPQLLLSQQDTLICKYDSIQIQGLSSINPVSFQWNTGSQSTSIYVAPQTNQSYTLLVSDSIGCADSAHVVIEVQDLPSLSLSTSNPHSCAGDSILHTAFSNTGVNFMWDNVCPTDQRLFFPQTSAWHHMLVSDSLGCMNQDSIFQKVNPLPLASIQPSAPEICIGDSVTLYASSSINPVNFLWNTNQSTSQIMVNPQATLVYTVTVSDSIGCSSQASKQVIVNNLPQLSFANPNPEICRGDSVQLSVSSNTAIQTLIWSSGQSYNPIQVSPSTSSTYIVELTDIHNCINTDTQTVIVYDNPIVNIIPNTLYICDGDTVTLSSVSNHPTSSILWGCGKMSSQIDETPIHDQNYHVTVTDTNGCIGSDTAMIYVKPRPVIHMTASKNTVCSADSVSLSYVSNTTHGTKIHWDFDGGKVLSSGSITNPVLQWNNAGNYVVSISASRNGCTSYPDTAAIKVNQTPIIDFVALPTHSCESLLVNFENRTQNIKAFYWDFGNPLDQHDTSSLQHPSYAYPYAGIYSVSLLVTSNENCVAYDSKPGYIEVYKNPVASFGGYPNQTSILEPNVSFWDFSRDATQWEYNFDDNASGINNSSTERYPWHQFSDTGHYNVSLVVTNQHGCTDTTYQDIHIKPFPQLYYPNAFSPNGDGLNDEFIIKGHDFDWSSFQMIIFDRWGSPVYESQDYQQGWNGRIQNSGDLCPTANYVFVIKVKDKDGIIETFRGNIMLVK
jgi:gliding motility-associated-like protein